MNFQGLCQIFSVHLDISEQKESDARLVELEEKHRGEMKTIQDEIAAWTEVSLKGKSPLLEERGLNKYPVRALSANYEVKSQKQITSCDGPFQVSALPSVKIFLPIVSFVDPLRLSLRRREQQHGEHPRTVVGAWSKDRPCLRENVRKFFSTV